jgi:hypothetical protein
MKKDARCVTGINFLATMIRLLPLSMSLRIQNHKDFSIPIQQILLTVTCILWINVAFSQPFVQVSGGDIPPWEHEAFRNDARLVKRCKEPNEILFPVSKTDAYVDDNLNQKQISDFLNRNTDSIKTMFSIYPTGD